MKITLSSTIITLCAALSAHAAVMIQPSAVSANAPLFGTNYNINQLIDQVHVTVPYTHGATDYTSYLASSPLAAPINTPIVQYAAMFTTPTLVLDFDLGAIWVVSNVVLWNAPTTAAHITEFTVTISSTPNFESFTNLGTFTTTPSSGYPMTAQGFDTTSSVEGRYIRLTTTSSHASNTLLGEVAFAGTAVPEPSGILLFSVGSAALIFRRRNR